MAKRSALATSETVPSLRSALWLYFLVLVCTAFITIQLSGTIDPLFVRFSIAVIVVAGFVFGAMRLSKLPMTSLFGNFDTTNFALSVVIGLLLFVPAQWLFFITYNFLENNVGSLPAPLSPQPISEFAFLLQLGIIIPFCYGLLFWGYLQRAAQSTLKIGGVLLTGILFALYGIFTLDGSSAVPGLLVVGILAALIVYLTNSFWNGFAVNMGFNLGLLYLLTPLGIFLDRDGANFFSVRWLMAVIVSSFIVFILFQVIRFRRSETTIQPTVSTKKLWWVPLLLIAAVYTFVVIGEFVLRSQQPPRSGVGTNNTLPVAPPAGSTSEAP